MPLRDEPKATMSLVVVPLTLQEAFRAKQQASNESTITLHLFINSITK